ncbi:hypothetical protein [Nocardioides nitrophenolicus]|uniref:hypothetical protein n=1 Tax=Nocardioides nitrophenolicus TaxID=60489 RepID=UPI00195BC360|nr:hypothetical protein [Nocardioides nitrophenolicus]MBM7519916.1 hypothetical protein [Nocardioides nitrophenolicus]
MSTADRTAVVKLLKARGAKARRGHLRIPVGELLWYVDVLADGVGPTAPLRLEVGCWTSALPPEPDGGAVDCPLLLDVPLGADPVGATTALLDRVTAIGDLGALRGGLAELPGALVDQRLRDLL